MIANDIRKKNVSKLHEETHYDHDGVVTHRVERQTFSVPSEPPYVKFYISDIGSIHGLSKGQNDVLFQLVMLIGWDGIVSVSKGRFEKSIKPKISIEYQTFKNTVAKLVEKGIFIRVGRGELEANPYLFARGDWASIYERRQQIQMTITYGENGREINTTIR